MLSVFLTLALAANEPRELRWNAAADGAAAAVLVSGWIVSETALKKTLAPAQCHWCTTNGFDVSVRRAFNPGLLPSVDGNKTEDITSGVLGFGVLPVALVGVQAWLASEVTDAWLSTAAIDVLLAIESTFSALALNQAVKFSVGRARPFSIGGDPAGFTHPEDASLSFFSGHTTLAFGVVSSLATIAYLRGYKGAQAVWIVGAPLALITATMRLAADKHWASDVLVGALVGTTFGILMPVLFHAPAGQPEALTVRLVPTGQGVALVGTFQ